VAVVLAGGAQAPAQNPYGQVANVSLGASPSSPLWDQPTRLSGRIRRGGRFTRVTLQRRLYPSEKTFRTVQRGRADRNGRYRFGVRPHANTVYRVIASTRPQSSSPPLLVRVRMLVGLNSTSRPLRRGGLARLGGSVFPRHHGRLVYLQRKSPRGRWKTVARAVLGPGSNPLASRYRRRLRVRRTAVYRVVVRGHDDHAKGISRERTITVS
jgi:hypothetical protein